MDKIAKMKRTLVPLTLLLLLPHLNPLTPKKDLKQAPEYQAKAAFLIRFCNYIDWPGEPGNNDISKPFVITVIGENPFFIKRKRKAASEDWLSKSYKNRKIKGKTVEIRHISEVKDIPGCHILFVSRSMKKELPEIIEMAQQHSILTIADTAGFAQKGVYINLIFIKGKRPRFEVNETGIRSSGLEVNFRLLQYAEIVNPIKKRRQSIENNKLIKESNKDADK
jgi:hypothetical protein